MIRCKRNSDSLGLRVLHPQVIHSLHDLADAWRGTCEAYATKGKSIRVRLRERINRLTLRSRTVKDCGYKIVPIAWERRATFSRRYAAQQLSEPMFLDCILAGVGFYAQETLGYKPSPMVVARRGRSM